MSCLRALALVRRGLQSEQIVTDYNKSVPAHCRKEARSEPTEGGQRLGACNGRRTNEANPHSYRNICGRDIVRTELGGGRDIRPSRWHR